MTTDVTTPKSQAVPLAAAAGAGLLIGFVSIFFSISFSVLIFSGPLEPFVYQGIALGLFGGTVFSVTAAIAGNRTGMWWGSQTVTVVLLSVAIAQLPAMGLTGERLFATAVMLIAVSTLFGGLCLYVVGRARLGVLAKFIPYPVIGGFLAASGLLLIERAFEIALGPGLTIGQIANPESWGRWLPVFCVGATLSLMPGSRLVRLLLPLAIVVYLVIFYAYLALNGLSLADAAAAGLVLEAVGASDTVSAIPALSPSIVTDADYGAIARLAPILVAIAFLAVVGTMLNVSANDIAFNLHSDLDLELRHAGAANAVSSLGGGFIGFPSVSISVLSKALVSHAPPLVGLTAAGLYLLVLLFGLEWMGHLPVGALVLVLFYLGFQISYRWLIRGFSELPRDDFAIVLLIVVVALLFGFPASIALGFIAASLLFTLAYSRVALVRSQMTAAVRTSSMERSAAEAEYLATRGAETVILEMQGFMFFGSVGQLLDAADDALQSAGEDIRHLILDFRRVHGMDLSSAMSFVKLENATRRRGTELILTGLNPDVRDRIDRSGACEDVRMVDTLDAALVTIEEAALADRAAGAEAGARSAIAEIIDELEAKGVPLAGPAEALAAGATVLEQGAPSDGLVLLLEGRLAAVIAQPEADVLKVATLTPGAIVGEIGYYTGTPRSARVVAETACVIRRIQDDAIAAATKAAPVEMSAFHARLARLMAKRLGRTTSLAVALDR